VCVSEVRGYGKRLEGALEGVLDGSNAVRISQFTNNNNELKNVCDGLVLDSFLDQQVDGARKWNGRAS
jgi:hypothetical protein